jgi:tetratricopeptide (TPR) repeat protein
VRRAAGKGLLGEHQAAIDDATEALKLKPNSVEGLVVLANHEAALGKLKDALTNLNKVLEMDMKKGDAYLLRGFVNKSLGNIKASEEDLKMAADLGVKVPETATK